MSKGVVIVTGSSRGLGAEIAVESATAGNDVVINYVDPEKEKRANEVADRVEEIGRTALIVRADITDPSQAQMLLDRSRNFAEQRDSEVSTLVLSAAGGLEKGADIDRAIYVNALSQWWLASHFLMSERNHGNRSVRKDVVFVTSNPSHFFGHPNNVMPSPGYELVAESKHEGEKMLREELGDPSFRIDHRLLVATADFVDGTAGATLLRLAHRRATGNRSADLLAERSAQLQGLIGRGVANASEFGGAIVSMFSNEYLPHGHTLYVPRPVLLEYIVPESELPYGLGQQPGMHTFHE